MPPKQTITKNMIVDAAFQLVRKKGLSALSARNIANTLGCSTQPVYSSFKSMDMLEEAVIQMAVRFARENYLVSKTQQQNNFRSIGVGYIAMAKQDKHLFDLLYVSGKTPLDFENHVFPIDTDVLLNVMKKDPYLRDLPREDLLDLLCHMWIYTHGLTVLTSTNPSVSEAFVHSALEKMGHMVVINKLMEKGVCRYEDFCD